MILVIGLLQFAGDSQLRCTFSAMWKPLAHSVYQEFYLTSDWNQCNVAHVLRILLRVAQTSKCGLAVQNVEYFRHSAHFRAPYKVREETLFWQTKKTFWLRLKEHKIDYWGKILKFIFRKQTDNSDCWSIQIWCSGSQKNSSDQVVGFGMNCCDSG